MDLLTQEKELVNTIINALHKQESHKVNSISDCSDIVSMFKYGYYVEWLRAYDIYPLVCNLFREGFASHSDIDGLLSAIYRRLSKHNKNKLPIKLNEKLVKYHKEYCPETDINDIQFATIPCINCGITLAYFPYIPEETHLNEYGFICEKCLKIFG